jgi:Ca2+-transporting ATPase
LSTPLLADTADPSPRAGSPEPWHALDPARVALDLDVDPLDGLSPADVTARRAVHGPNQLVATAKRSPWLVFLDQFRNLLIVVLIGAAVLAGLVGDYKDTIVIGVVLLFNAVLGFVQEHRAEKSLAALRSMLVSTARIRRDGRVTEVDAADLVPGDVVLVEAGDRIAADGRLVVAHAVEVDESALTGESTPSGSAPCT